MIICFLPLCESGGHPCAPHPPLPSEAVGEERTEGGARWAGRPPRPRRWRGRRLSGWASAVRTHTPAAPPPGPGRGDGGRPSPGWRWGGTANPYPPPQKKNHGDDRNACFGGVCAGSQGLPRKRSPRSDHRRALSSPVKIVGSRWGEGVAHGPAADRRRAPRSRGRRHRGGRGPSPAAAAPSRPTRPHRCAAHPGGGGVRGVGCLAPKVEHHPRADSLFTPTRRSVPTPRCSPALRPACDPLTKRWDRR